MKNFVPLFFISVLVIYSQSVLAQYEKGIHTLDYSNSNGEQGISTYIYNSHDTPYKAIWELKDGSRWSVNYHEFDKQGNLVKREREFSDSIFLVQYFFYDKNNNITSETFQRSDGVKGKVTYIYENNLLQYADCQGLNGWFYGKISYRYNKNQKKITAILLKKDKELGEINYEYDERGRLIIEKWNFIQGFSQTFTYRYLDNDCIIYKSSNIYIQNTCSSYIIKENYDYSGKGGGPSYYKYEDGNELVQKTFVRSDGLKTITTYNYLDNGLLHTSQRKYQDGKTGNFSYIYNQYRQLLERNFLRSDGASSTEKYIYDQNGKLLSAHIENFDGWLSGELLFHHDRYDRIQTAEFISRDNNNASISFKYNTSGQLIQIHWNFINDATQTYDFIYSELSF